MSTNDFWVESFSAGDNKLLLATTPFQIVDLSVRRVASPRTAGGPKLTSNYREGMVVKPIAFITTGKRFAQPAIKCRGPINQTDPHKLLRQGKEIGLTAKEVPSARVFGSLAASQRSIALPHQSRHLTYSV
jgi:PNKP adenylyltransferase domain, ligase domain